MSPANRFPDENKKACFLGAIQAVAEKRGKKEVGERAVVHADVILGEPTDRPGYGLKVVLRVEGVEDQAILDAAHEVRHKSIIHRWN
jgi:organic hydroperoxide reductase OsmC/OhrA